MLVDPIGVFADPEIRRLAAIEDSLAFLHWRMAGAPEDKMPKSVVQYERLALAKKNAPPPVKGKIVDVRAELARRQAGGKSAVSKPKIKKTNPKAQAIRDELARRRAAANE